MNKITSIKDISEGMTAKASHLITSEKIENFANLSGDFNPIHLDEEFAKNTKFGKRIAHGALVSSFFSTLFASELPGPGSIYICQNSKFVHPVFIDDTVDVEVKVEKINLERNRVYFSTNCYVGDKKVLDGTAEIYFP